ncbi:ArsR/SmtB family transcription factor [Nisaea nitritireducens]|uniref:ArsR/SmtB family transcription factor n=1 Tax=Nisaea nitritireducens TaxID=568392 RepID=UPI0018660C9D|nr:metalloregulator ArsR/SmtB family transcription factor [Nisaea nitritireducens]
MPALDQTFAALSDGTRRAILARLHDGEVTLSEIAQPFDMSQTAVSKHVRVLSDAGLVSVHKRGRTRYCALNAAPMKDATDWLNTYKQFWEDGFKSLARFLEEEK